MRASERVAKRSGGGHQSSAHAALFEQLRRKRAVETKVRRHANGDGFSFMRAMLTTAGTVAAGVPFLWSLMSPTPPQVRGMQFGLRQEPTTKVAQIDPIPRDAKDEVKIERRDASPTRERGKAEREFAERSLDHVRKELAKKTFLSCEPACNLAGIALSKAQVRWILEHLPSEIREGYAAKAWPIQPCPPRPSGACVYVLHMTDGETPYVRESQVSRDASGVRLFVNRDGSLLYFRAAPGTATRHQRADGTTSAAKSTFVHLECVGATRTPTPAQIRIAAYDYLLACVEAGRILDVTFHGIVDRAMRDAHGCGWSAESIAAFYRTTSEILALPPVYTFGVGVDYAKTCSKNVLGATNCFVDYMREATTAGSSRPNQYDPSTFREAPSWPPKSEARCGAKRNDGTKKKAR